MDKKRLVSGYGEINKDLKLEDVGAGICSYRQGAGLTQEALGSMLGMDKSQISKIEKGGNLTISTISKVYSAMGAQLKLSVFPAESVSPAEYLGDLVTAVSAFARNHGLSERQAFGYLDRFGGIDFYLQDPLLESELPLADTLEAFLKVCRRNGGGI